MSLFDVIKYPISVPPTEEELKALPIKIYQSWLSKDIKISPEFSPHWVTYNMLTFFEREHLCNCLRKRILEYEG